MTESVKLLYMLQWQLIKCVKLEYYNLRKPIILLVCVSAKLELLINQSQILKKVLGAGINEGVKVRKCEGVI